METTIINNEGLNLLEENPKEKYNLNTIEEQVLNDLLVTQNPYWIALFQEHNIYRFLSSETSVDVQRKVSGDFAYRPIILINGYQSNRSTWNKFAQQLWNIGFRSIFALEPQSYTSNLHELYETLDEAIDTVLSFLTCYKSVTLVGHSVGGLLARNYVKHSENCNNLKVSLVITLASPHYGVLQTFKSFESFFKLVFDSNVVDLFSHKKGIQRLNKIHQKSELLQVTEINVQGSLKRLRGGDGTFRPEPVSEMINYVVHRNHFRVNKSLKVFNLVEDYLLHKANVFKIQLNCIDFLNIHIINHICIFFTIKVGNHEQRYPVEDDIEITAENKNIKPQIIFSGKFNELVEEEEIIVSLFHKRRLSNQKLLESSFNVQKPTDEKPRFEFHTLENQLLSLNLISTSYNMGNEI